MFVRKSKFDAMHDEAKACSQMAIALAEQLNKAAAERDESRRRHALTEIDACNLASECNRLRSKLAVFTAPRARDSKGHFLPRRATPSHTPENVS